MGSASYSWEKCNAAVVTLATGTEDLRERLSNAWWYSLNSLTGAPIPWRDLREQLEQIGERLMPEISSERIPRMQEDELRAIAKEIVSLYDNVCQRYAKYPDATEHTVSGTN